MTMTELYPWPTTFAMTTTISSQIRDTSVTKKLISSQMHKCNTNSVTKWISSQMTTCDHFGAFGDVKGMSLMTTSLLVEVGQVRSWMNLFSAWIYKHVVVSVSKWLAPIPVY
jgi:hypothetical protein